MGGRARIKIQRTLRFLERQARHGLQVNHPPRPGTGVPAGAGPGLPARVAFAGGRCGAVLAGGIGRGWGITDRGATGCVCPRGVGALLGGPSVVWTGRLALGSPGLPRSSLMA
jgi:hypothetical protein